MDILVSLEQLAIQVLLGKQVLLVKLVSLVILVLLVQLVQLAPKVTLVQALYGILKELGIQVSLLIL